MRSRLDIIRVIQIKEQVRSQLEPKLDIVIKVKMRSHFIITTSASYKLNKGKMRSHLDFKLDIQIKEQAQLRLEMRVDKRGKMSLRSQLDFNLDVFFKDQIQLPLDIVRELRIKGVIR